MSRRAGDWSFAVWFGVAFAIALAVGLLLVLVSGDSLTLIALWTVFASAVTLGVFVGVLGILFGGGRPASGRRLGR